MEKDFKLLNSTSIKIPNNLEIIYNFKDTIIGNILESKLKYIVYTDSTNCSMCNIAKMYLWEPFLNYTKKHNKQINFYFIFHATNMNEKNIKEAFKLSPISYPILIDKNGDFEKLNPHLPKNKQFHIFLLDENNKVILVGNPLANKKVEKLFYKKMQEFIIK